MIRSIHRWLGLCLCFSVLCISVTGVLLLWKKEYLWWTIPEARQTISNDTIKLARTIEAIEKTYDAEELLSIRLHAEDLSLHKVFLSDKRYAWHDSDGNKIQEWTGNQRWEDFFLDLHHRFLLGNTIGLNIAGFSGLLLLPLTVLGVIIWWPRRRTFKQGLWPKRFVRSPLLVSHGNLGIITIAPLLLLAFSGVVLVYPNEASQILVEPFVKKQLSAAPQGTGGLYKNWQAVLDKSLAEYPNGRFRWVSPPSKYADARVVGLQQAEGWNSSGQTSLYFNFEDGSLEEKNDALKQATAKRFYNFQYPLHTGGLGLWYRIIMSLFGLAVAALCIVGFSSYLKR